MLENAVSTKENGRSEHPSADCGPGPPHSNRQPMSRSVGTSLAHVVRASITSSATVADPLHRSLVLQLAMVDKVPLLRVPYECFRQSRLFVP